MPKINSNTPCLIDLHLHLDGSISVSTARHLAELQGIAVPQSDSELHDMLTLTPECITLDDYLARFIFACSLLHTREALRIATHDLFARLKEQGVIYAEVRFAPQKSCENGLTQSDAIDAVLEGMRSVDMPSGLIISMMRGNDNRAENLETVLLAEKYLGRGVVGVDIAGAETIFPTEDYADVFAIAHERGIPFTIHAGEGRGAESVAKAISFGASRIGHGVRSLEDESVVAALVEKGIALELCPTSNLHTHLFDSYEAYPLRELMKIGVKVTLNTDNMTVSDITLKQEWENMCEAFQLTRAEIRQILLNTVDASFAQEPVKAQLRKQIEDAYPRVYLKEITDITEAEVDAMTEQLPLWRKEKAQAFRHFQGRKESVVAFALLQQVLREEYGIEGDIEFEYNEHGKPSLKNHPEIFFNISHCKAVVACAVGNEPIGIDVEMRGRYKEPLARHVLSEEEFARVQASDDMDLEFTKYWTQKEALLKLIGTGVSTDLKVVLTDNTDKKITTTECDGYVYSVAK